ncbi:MAG: DUF4402 domain-containing protein [Alphaproteobacteria bacterium]|nr:DUF4402 domain-containing protein [Alphaproteobacteria bacterium]
MKKLLGVSLVAMMTLLGSTAVEAATAEGEARINVITPLSIEETASVDFGDVAMDTGTSGTISIAAADGAITCPSTYICAGSGTVGSFTINGKADEVVTVSIDDEADLYVAGQGATALHFVPTLSTSTPTLTSGTATITVGGSIAVNGDEPAGDYSTTNTTEGGSAYALSVVY